MSMHGAWKNGDIMNMAEGWSYGQHLDAAAKLLEGNVNGHMSEEGDGLRPPWLSYVRDPDQSVAEPIDYTPYLAALTHAIIGTGQAMAHLAQIHDNREYREARQ